MEDITHCLPFEVMGTEYHYENKHIFANDNAEPDKPYNKNAIAVYIMSSTDYEKVGYLPTELTRFVHSQPKDPKLEVTVRQIRFCTTFLINGFEISTNDLREKPCSD